MMVKDTPGCRLQILKRWSPESHFWGVVAAGGRITLDRSVFQCCDGSGVYVDPTSPRDARLCGLSKRWSLLSGLIEHWQLLEQKSIGTLPPAKTIQQFSAPYFDACLRQDRGKIVALAEDTKSKDLSAPWALASVLAWHFEVLPLITRIGSGTIPMQWWTDLIKRFPGARTLVLVDGVTDMWNPARVEAIEAVIAFASERRLPLWLFERRSELSASASDAATRRGFKNAVKNRIDQTRAKSALSWLSEQGLSRLAELCEIELPRPQTLKIPDQV
jgi:hypothetical protein